MMKVISKGKAILNRKVPGSIFVESESDTLPKAEVSPQEHHGAVFQLKVKIGNYPWLKSMWVY